MHMHTHLCLHRDLDLIEIKRESRKYNQKQRHCRSGLCTLKHIRMNICTWSYIEDLNIHADLALHSRPVFLQAPHHLISTDCYSSTSTETSSHEASMTSPVNAQTPTDFMSVRASRVSGCNKWEIIKGRVQQLFLVPC